MAICKDADYFTIREMAAGIAIHSINKHFL
jgi:hypothetical protein